MEYFQVQYQKLNTAWEPYGEASETKFGAQQGFVDMLTKYKGYDQVRAFRIVSVWQRWDKTWTVKEVLEYKDNPCAS